jgi:hypothetical protein
MKRIVIWPKIYSVLKSLKYGAGRDELRRNKRALFSIRRMPFLLGIYG